MGRLVSLIALATLGFCLAGCEPPPAPTSSESPSPAARRLPTLVFGSPTPTDVASPSAPQSSSPRTPPIVTPSPALTSSANCFYRALTNGDQQLFCPIEVNPQSSYR